MVLLVDEVRLRLLLLVRAVRLLQGVRADATVEFLLILLLLSLDKRWYLGDHISRWTGSLRGELARCGRGALATSLGNETLGMQVCAHYWHARVLTHLWWVALELA